MTIWRRWRLAWRFTRRELVAGELTILGLALLVAVAAMSSVAFFSDRVDRALTEHANQLLAADLVLNGNEPAAPAIRAEARKRGLVQAENVSFPSMVFANEQAVLATFKAVTDNYPLRGEVSVRLAKGGQKQGALRPAPGTAWADARLISRLKLKLGDTLEVGNARLTLAGEILREPDGTLDIYNFVPRLMFNHADLAATGLVQQGSRLRWRLMLAGDGKAVAQFRAWLQPQLKSGMRLESIEEARPEIRTALERARRFLGLSAMLTVALAAAAVGMAVRRYLARHWQPVAVLRCLGLSANEVWGLFSGLFLLLALLAGGLGTVAGYALQSALMQLARQWVGGLLPAPGLLPWLTGPLSALVLLLGLALPPLLTLRQVPPLAVLRDELRPSPPSRLAPLAAVAALLALTAWQVGDLTLAGWLLGSMAGFLASVGLVAFGAVWLMRRLPTGARVGWRFGIANMARRPWLAVIQIVALSVGLMALLTLTVVRSDLIAAWQQSVPADAPNKFVINIQPAQLEPFKGTFVGHALPAPELSPMVRARLTAINGQPVQPSSYASEQAQRLAEREFNLSWRDTLPSGNRVSAGQWWGERARPQFSVEQGLAETLGIRLGDHLTFNIGGTPYEAQATSLRKVSWDSFRVNFFVVAPPNWFADQPASYITSFRLAEADEDFVNQLVAQFPNITVIDVSAILAEVRSMVDQLSRAVEALFVLALVAGVLVLWAALASTRDERLFDVGLMRALGASRLQVRSVVLAELMWLGALTGLMAALGATAIGAIAAVKLFNLPLVINPWLLPLGVISGMLVVGLAGWPLVRRVTRSAPAAVLRAL
ncbi:ABC transporter permease [Pseudogulbenkiania sp. MAI-1]|uniref:ABC transporter permease n=1 Tax=Pseudogulbenkiania sp. MAI-1 TaxID=990370 RepID=UPI00045E8490|nr:FtsX-like permease family protein [Pseudogulbenkiania sp. MAI-1]